MGAGKWRARGQAGKAGRYHHRRPCQEGCTGELGVLEVHRRVGQTRPAGCHRRVPHRRPCRTCTEHRRDLGSRQADQNSLHPGGGQNARGVGHNAAVFPRQRMLSGICRQGRERPSRAAMHQQSSLTSAQHPRHTWQSYKDRYRKYLINTPDKGAAAAPSSSIQQHTSVPQPPPAKPRTPAAVSSHPSKKRNYFTAEEDQILRDYVLKRLAEGEGESGNRIYQEMEAMVSSSCSL